MRLQDYYSGIVLTRRPSPPTRDEARRDFDARFREMRHSGAFTLPR